LVAYSLISACLRSAVIDIVHPFLMRGKTDAQAGMSSSAGQLHDLICISAGSLLGHIVQKRQEYQHQIHPSNEQAFLNDCENPLRLELAMLDIADGEQLSARRDAGFVRFQRGIATTQDHWIAK